MWGMQVFDIETGLNDIIVDLNPGGWIPGVTTEKTWNMCAACIADPTLWSCYALLVAVEAPRYKLLSGASSWAL